MDKHINTPSAVCHNAELHLLAFGSSGGKFKLTALHLLRSQDHDHLHTSTQRLTNTWKICVGKLSRDWSELLTSERGRGLGVLDSILCPTFSSYGLLSQEHRMNKYAARR